MPTNSNQEKEIVVIGLGYVGLTMAAHMASLGMNVLGIEVRELVLTGLRAKRAFFYEPGLDHLLAQTINDGTFKFNSELLNILFTEELLCDSAGNSARDSAGNTVGSTADNSKDDSTGDSV